MKLTLKSIYYSETARTINSNSPRYIKSVREEIRKGSGDTVTITDEAGNRYDVTDRGRGLVLVNTNSGEEVVL